MTVSENSVALDNGKEISFDFHVHTVLEFPNCFIVLWLDESLPENNIEAYDYDSNKLWNISDIIQLDTSDTYLYIWKGNEERFITGTSNHMRYTVDVMTKDVITESRTETRKEK